MLFDVFLGKVHPIIPICDVGNIQHEYSVFWTTFPFVPSIETLALVFAATYCGSLCSPLVGAQIKLRLFAGYRELIQSIEYSGGPKSLGRLQANLLIDTCRATQIEPLLSFQHLPGAIRTAQSLKLHLESSTSIPTAIRRQIWWHLIYLDVEASILSGLPKLIHDEDFTTKMPDAEQTSMSIAIQGRLYWSIYMRMWRRRSPNGGELETFKHCIYELIGQLPSSEGTWEQLYLEMQVDRAVCSNAKAFLNGKPATQMACDHQLLR